LKGIIFRLRRRCPGNRRSKHFVADATLHRWFQRGCRRGIFARLWMVLRDACGERGGVHGAWQRADGRRGQARLGGKKGGTRPPGRAQAGSQGSVVVERDGGPLGIAAAPHRNDHVVLEETIEAMVVERPVPTPEQATPLSLEAASDNPARREGA